MIFILFQILAGIFAASFIEWTVHKHILHELGKKKVSIFSFHWGKHHAAARRNGFVDTLAHEFPEFVMIMAEENWVRGYQQGIDDATKLPPATPADA